MSYFPAARHPVPNVGWVLLLLAIYEVGAAWIGGPPEASVRTGADIWLRYAVSAFGLPPVLVPIVIAGGLVGWAWWRWADRPEQTASVGMHLALESFLFAIGLWALSRFYAPLLEAVGVPTANVPIHEQPAGQLLTYLGAGIYEEILFRVLLYGGLMGLLRAGGVERRLARAGALIASAILFAAAHHLGPYGQPMDGFIFSFRVLVGIYCGLLYQFRGFGIAVGAHAGYDVLVGVAV